MTATWATVHVLSEFFDELRWQANVELDLPTSDGVHVQRRLASTLDECGALSRELIVEVHAGDRSAARVQDCIITIEIVGLCSFVTTAFARDARDALAEACESAIRHTETRLAAALWPPLERAS